MALEQELDGPPGRRRATATNSEAATDRVITRTGEAAQAFKYRAVQRPGPTVGPL